MFIKCVTMTKKYILLILFPIFKIIGIALEKKLLFEKVKDLYSNLFIIPFLISLGNILCVFLWIFRIKLNLRKNETLKDKPNIEESFIKDRESKTRSKKRGMSQVEIFKEEIIKKNQMKLLKEIFILFFLGLIFLIATILNFAFFIYSKEKKDNLIILLFTSCIIRFLLMLIFSLFFLKEPDKIYRHQKFSLLFIVSLAIIYFFTAFECSKEAFIRFSFLIGSDILYSLFYIGGKKYILITYKSPFKMIFFVGIICFILICILYFIFMDNNDNIIIEFFSDHLQKNIGIDIDIKKNDIYINIYRYFDKINNNIFLLIPKLILIFLNNFFEWQILSFFSINHFNSSYFLYIIILPFINENVLNFWIFISFYILVVFFLLIFNEIIIIYSFSLEKNTIHEKRMRSIVDEKNNYEMGRVSLETDPNEDDLNNIDENEANALDDKSSIN